MSLPGSRAQFFVAGDRLPSGQIVCHRVDGAIDWLPIG